VTDFEVFDAVRLGGHEQVIFAADPSCGLLTAIASTAAGAVQRSAVVECSHMLARSTLSQIPSAYPEPCLTRRL